VRTQKPELGGRFPGLNPGGVDPCTVPLMMRPDESRKYVVPRWPEGAFNLQAIEGGFTLGPCTRESWSVADDGAVSDWRADGAHPIHLRVRMQAGDLLYANDGDIGPMTYRIVPVTEDGVTSDLSRSAFDLSESFAALLTFAGESLTKTSADLERSFEHSDASGIQAVLKHRGITAATLEAGLVARDQFGRLNDIVHAAAITAVLPLLLEPGERAEFVSLAAGNSPNRPFDLATDRRIAEFKLSRWDGHDTARKLHLTKDLVHLAADGSGRRGQLFVFDERPIQFAAKSKSLIGNLLRRFPATLELFKAQFGDPEVSISQFRLAGAAGVEIIDLRPILGQVELYPEVVDACEEEGGVPSRLIKTDAGDGRQEGTPWMMFAGSPSGRATRRTARRSGSRWMTSRGRALGG